MTRSALLLLPALAAGCMSMIMPAKKPLPPRIADDPALEQAATDAALHQPGSSGTTITNADIIHARIVAFGKVEQDPMTRAPRRRYVSVAVVLRSRKLANTCTWGTYVFSQPYAGDAYALDLKKEWLSDRGAIDCDAPELHAQPGTEK
jgi:hypothetical protein